MMEDYLKIREQLENAQFKLEEKLEKILKKNNIRDGICWFNFNDNTPQILWYSSTLKPQMIKDIEESFGEIAYIETTKLSDTFKIILKKVEEVE